MAPTTISHSAPPALEMGAMAFRPDEAPGLEFRLHQACNAAQFNAQLHRA
jgi:hypothetical protein